jgi:hypothetical protein
LWTFDLETPIWAGNWRDVNLESGIYYVVSDYRNEWAMWNVTAPEVVPLTTWESVRVQNPDHIASRGVSYLPFSALLYCLKPFPSAKFLFQRNSNGSYRISNQFRAGSPAIMRYLRTSDDGQQPVLSTAVTSCRLYPVNDSNDKYVYVITMKYLDLGREVTYIINAELQRT